MARQTRKQWDEMLAATRKAKAQERAAYWEKIRLRDRAHLRAAHKALRLRKEEAK